MLGGLRTGLLTASASRHGGGVFEAVVLHAEMIRYLGGQVEVFALADADSAADAGRLGDARVHHCPVAGPRMIGYSPELVRRLMAANLDILHLHGIWMYPSAAGASWASRTGRPYFISPHGMLDPWITGRGRLKKQVARLAYERRSWAAAHRLHALTAREAEDIRRESGRDDSLIIPNSGPPPGAAAEPRVPPTFVYIGRVHPKKNLIALVRAWHASRRPPGARLVLAGWGDDRSLRQLREAIGEGDGSAEFIGPVFGAAKDNLLRSASWIVLPSLSEGLPMAVLESWAAGVPVIMTSECNLPEGFAAGAALECGLDAASITATIEQACRLGQADRLAMSAAGLSLARSTFGFDQVARAWGMAYLASVGS